MSIAYNHAENIHTLSGPMAALPVLFANKKPASLLDVGCGTGTWLKAALDFGISNVFGVDGIQVSLDTLHVSNEKIQIHDLTRPWSLKQRFDVVICLEVGEHLDSVFAPVLVDALVEHADRIYFSAACPGQIGQHHVNGQWPDYWQQLFNERGYVCDDQPRWQIWGDSRIEPWYRQNLFLARLAPEMAGHEPRLKPVVHPAMLPLLSKATSPSDFKGHIQQIEQGRMPILWHLTMPVQALWSKMKRALK